MKDKICILGKLPTKYEAPFNDESFEIWTMNKHIDHDLIPRIDKTFDIHINPENKNADVLRADFPMEQLQDKLGGNYLNNITSYLIAYATCCGAKEIHLYGMRFDADHDHRKLEYYNVREIIFYAKGRGVKIFDYDGILTKEFIVQEGQDYDS